MKCTPLVILSLSLAFFGCDDESDDTGAGGSGGQSTADGAATRQDSGVGTRMDSSTGSRMDAMVAQDSAVQADMFVFTPPPVGQTSCDDVNLVACFSNYDCQDAFEICLNVGTAELAVPCCFAADVGQKTLGMPCSEAVGESQCDTSICITGDNGSFCSDRCETVADCPATMQDCRAIAFSGDDASWCFPSE